MHLGDLNSGPHSCSGNALSTETSPQKERGVSVTLRPSNGWAKIVLRERSQTLESFVELVKVKREWG